MKDQIGNMMMAFPILQMGIQDVVHLKEKLIANRKRTSQGSGLRHGGRCTAKGILGPTVHVVGAAEVA